MPDERTLLDEMLDNSDRTVLLGGQRDQAYGYRYTAALTYGATAEINDVLSGTVYGQGSGSRAKPSIAGVRRDHGRDKHDANEVRLCDQLALA